MHAYEIKTAMATPETHSQRPQVLKTIGEEATKLSSSPIRQLRNSFQTAPSTHINVILANPEVFFAGLERQSKVTHMLGKCSTNELYP